MSTTTLKSGTCRDQLALTASLALIGILGVGMASLVCVSLVADIHAAGSELDAEMANFRVSSCSYLVASRRFL